MAKILITYYWPYKLPQGYSPTMCFYDGLRIAFEKNNHDVLEINLANFANYPKIDNITNNSILEINNDYLYEKINLYKPDLIISFNHCLTKKIYSITTCPIFIWDGDSPSSPWWYNTDLINSEIDRLFFAYTSIKNFNFFKKLWQIKDEKLFYTKLATSLEPEQLNFDKDICFIGSTAKSISLSITKYLIKIESSKIEKLEFIKIIKIAIRDGIFNPLIKDFLIGAEIKFEEFYWYISQFKRNGLLELLSEDFNLEIFGWTNLDQADKLYIYFDKTPVFSVKNNQEIYNSSKIALNINQPQVCNEESKYSWRVCDIMATNSCLVSSFCPALEEDFSKWVKIPQFSNKFEAYNICRKLLSDESWRKDVVENSKIAIKEGGFTFDDRVREIEQIFNLKKYEDFRKINYEFLLDLTPKEIQEEVPLSIKKSKFSIFKVTKKLIRIFYKINVERIVRFPLKLYKFLYKKNL